MPILRFARSSQHSLIGVLLMLFSNRMISEVVQPFWAAVQRGEFITEAAESVGTYREMGGQTVGVGKRSGWMSDLARHGAAPDLATAIASQRSSTRTPLHGPARSRRSGSDGLRCLTHRRRLARS
jgi:hypothetical protein